MRKLLLAMLLAAAGLPAHAASIENLRSGTTSADSIMVLSCQACTGKPNQGMRNYTVPALAKGVATMAIVDKNGKPEVRRIDKFLGGSPVVTYSQAQPPLIEAMRDADQQIAKARAEARATELAALDDKLDAIQPPDARQASANAGIDRRSTTASLILQAEARDFDPARFKLRLK